MLFSVFLGFLLGALAIILAQVFGFLFILNRLSSKYSNKQKLASQLPNTDLDPQQSLSFAYNKQGVLWVLEPEKIPKLSGNKLPKEKKSKKEIFEVFPVKKRAKIKDHSLILTDSDGSQATIYLVGCTIVSVSASNLSSRKWAKRYPVKVDGRNSPIYKGSRTFYIFLETSWEKESWCKALRLASSDDKKRENWYAKLNKEFHNYITTLNAGNPSLKKSSIGSFGEVIDRSSHGSSSRVRQFLKKLTKKAGKNGNENKGIGTSTSHREERKMGEKSRLHDMLSVTGSLKYSTEDTSHNSLDEDNVLPLPSNLSHSGSQNSDTLIFDSNFNDKLGLDEGTLCCNLLISRLFFDAKRNTEMKNSIQSRIQRTLSNMRTPSYIGGINCTGLDLGTLPPYIHSMRVLPMDMSDVWAIEMDIEYSGGALLDIETRLEVREPDLQKEIVNTSLESSSMEHMTAELLEDFEFLGNQLNLSEEKVGEIEKKQEGDNKHEGIKMSKCSSWKSAYASRWNSILNSIAKQVSQVPISLTIRIASVRGTLRLHIKPPPSDQLWIAFTSMPDIDFKVESSVGDHKVTSGHVAVILANRFKAAIRDTLVLPNCESVCIPWMIADKEDWVPREAAPFIWINHQGGSEPTSSKVSSTQNGDAESELEASEQSPNNLSENGHDKAHILVPTLEQPEESTSSTSPSLSASSSTSHSNATHSMQDLKIPLLFDESQNNRSRSESPEHHSTSEVLMRERHFPASEDGSPKKAGRRARMMDLGKKMSEKLEEKRRHIEERSRTMVEKMRGPP